MSGANKYEGGSNLKMAPNVDIKSKFSGNLSSKVASSNQTMTRLASGNRDPDEGIEE